MSELSYMEKLLDGVEVKRLTLGDIGEFIRGNGIQKKDLVEAGFPAVHYGQIFTKYGFSAVQSFTFISDELAKKSRIAQKNDLLIATTSENDEDVLKSIAWLGEKVAISGDMMLFRHTQNVKYLAYYFQTEDFQKQKIKFITGAKVRRVSRDSLTKMTISLPSLKVQTEIVRILDAFAELTAELTAELVSRKQQYAYYRKHLLTFEENKFEWKALGEVAEYSKTRISYELLDEKNYVGVNNLLQDKAGKEESSHVPTQGNSTKYQDNDILIGNIRPYLKKIWQADCTGGTNGDVLVVHPTDEAVHPRYLYQILADDNFFNYNMQHAKGAKMPRGDKARIMEYKIPIPSLQEQKRIVAILDKFEALTTSLTEGLPREIALRQQQYVYYRELLLSFPKPEVANHD